MTTIGERDEIVLLERATTTQNEYGEEIEAWGPLDGGPDPVKENTKIYYGRGDERRQAAMEQGRQPATFNVLSNERTRSLTLTDRLTMDGVVFDIEGIAPDHPRRGELEITAVRAA